MSHKHLHINPNDDFIRQIKRDIRKSKTRSCERTADEILKAYSAERRGHTIKRDIKNELLRNGLSFESFGDPDEVSTNQVITIRSYECELDRPCFIFGKLWSLIKDKEIRDFVREVPTLDPVNLGTTKEQVRKIFKEIDETWLPVENGDGKFVGGVSREHLNETKRQTKNGLPYTSRIQCFQQHQTIKELTEALETDPAFVRFHYDNYFLATKERIFRLISKTIFHPEN